MARKKRYKTSSKTEAITSFWDNLPTRTRHIIALAFLFLTPLFLVHEVIIGGQQFIAHDTIQWRAGAETLLSYEEETGDVALWATNMFGGMPAYMIYYPKAFFHFDTIVYGWFRSSFPFWSLLILLGGLYYFFILMGMRPLAAMAGSLIIAFTTYIPIIIGAGHNTKFLAWTYMPWVFAGFWLTTRGKYPLLGFFLMAMALNFVLRANHPQVLYYFLYVFLVWWLFDLYQAYKENGIPDWAKKTGLLFAAGIFALICNVQPYLSTYEYAPFSIRGGNDLTVEQSGRGSGLDVDYAFAWSQGRSELLTLIIPGIKGGSSADGTYWGPKTFTSGPHYFGAIAFLLFLIGAIKSPLRLRFVFIIAGILTMLFSLGENLYFFNKFFFDFAPFYNRFRTPEMWLIATVFSFGIVAVMGLQWIWDAAKEKTAELKSLYVPAGIVLGLALIFTLGGNALLSFEKPGERAQIAEQIAQQQGMNAQSEQVQSAAQRFINQQIIPARKELASSDSQRFLLFVGLAVALLALTLLGKLAPAYMAMGIVLLIAIDILSVGNRYLDKSGLVPNDLDMKRAIERRVSDSDRFIVQNAVTDEGWPYRTLPLASNAFNNAIPSFSYPSLGGYTGAKLRNIQNIIDFKLFTGPTGIQTEVLNMLNVKYLTFGSRINLPGFDLVFEGQRDLVFQNRNVLPKAFFVDELIQANTPDEAFDLLSEFKPSESAIVEHTSLPNITPDVNRSVRVTEYGPNRIQLDVSADDDAFLVLSEIWYPAGWKAYLNGNPVEIFKTNYLLRGFAIPAGEHNLDVRFEPRTHFISSRVSVIANILLLLIGLGIVYMTYKQHRAEKEA